jgi:RNA polymerase sigma-70 factor, ECF subfamily
MQHGQDTDEVRSLFVRHAERLVLYARQWLDRSAAEDVVQEVFIQLILRGPPRQAVEPWLYRCVRNGCISHMRGASRRDRRQREVARDHAGWFEPAASTQLDVEHAVRLLQDLPAEKREAVMLRIWGDLSFPQIAAVMQMPLSTVFNHYRGGLTRIREQMESPCQTNRT